MILSNQAKCLRCGDIIFSATVHDFRTCTCGNLSVDGGMDYIRRVYKDAHYIEDMSIQVPDAAVTACIEAIAWARKTGRNDLGMICAIARALRDNGVIINVPA